MTDYEKKIYERIEGAIDKVAQDYRNQREHECDLIADAFDELSNALGHVRMEIEDVT